MKPGGRCKPTHFRRDSMETWDRFWSSRANGTKRLSNCVIPSTWIQIIGSTITFLAERMNKEKDCPRLSKRSSAGLR